MGDCESVQWMKQFGVQVMIMDKWLLEGFVRPRYLSVLRYGVRSTSVGLGLGVLSDAEVKCSAYQLWCLDYVRTNGAYGLITYGRQRYGLHNTDELQVKIKINLAGIE